MATVTDIDAILAARKGEQPAASALGAQPAPNGMASTLLPFIAPPGAQQIAANPEEAMRSVGREFVPGFNMAEVMMSKEPVGPVQTTLAGVSDVLAAFPATSALRYTYRRLFDVSPKALPGKFISVGKAAEAAREISARAGMRVLEPIQEQVLTMIRPAETVAEAYALGTTAAREAGEVFYAPRVAQSIDDFLRQYSPSHVQKKTTIETFPKGYTEKSTNVLQERKNIPPKLSSTEMAGMRSTQSIKESERYLTGMEKVYADLADLRQRLAASNSAVDPADWASMRNQVDGIYKSVKNDPRSRDLVPVLAAFKKDLEAMGTTASGLFLKAGAASRLARAQEILEEAAIKHKKPSASLEGRPYEKWDGTAISRELDLPENKYIMEAIPKATRQRIKDTIGVISRIETLDSASKNLMERGLGSIKIPGTQIRMGKGGIQAAVHPPKDVTVHLVNLAMQLPGGTEMIRSVTKKGLLTKTSQIMLLNFVLSTARSRAYRPENEPIEFNP